MDEDEGGNFLPENLCLPFMSEKYLSNFMELYREYALDFLEDSDRITEEHFRNP